MFYCGVNEAVSNEFGETVGSYAEDFASVRPLFGYTSNYIKGVIKSAIKKWLKWGVE